MLTKNFGIVGKLFILKRDDIEINTTRMTQMPSAAQIYIDFLK